MSHKTGIFWINPDHIHINNFFIYYHTEKFGSVFTIFFFFFFFLSEPLKAEKYNHTHTFIFLLTISISGSYATGIYIYQAYISPDIFTELLFVSLYQYLTKWATNAFTLIFFGIVVYLLLSSSAMQLCIIKILLIQASHIVSVTYNLLQSWNLKIILSHNYFLHFYII